MSFFYEFSINLTGVTQKQPFQMSCETELFGYRVLEAEAQLCRDNGSWLAVGAFLLSDGYKVLLVESLKKTSGSVRSSLAHWSKFTSLCVIKTKKCWSTTKKYPITKAENVLVCPLNINCKHRNLIKQLKYDHFHIRHGWIGNYDRAPTVPNINVQNGVTVPEILWFDAEDQLKHQKKRTNLPASPHQKKISIYSRSTLKPAYYEPRLCLRWRPLVVIVVMAAKEADR